MCRQEGKSLQFGLHSGVIVPESLFFKTLAFQRFEVLLSVGLVGTGEGAVLMVLKAYSQHADGVPQHNVHEKTTRAGGR